MSDVVRWIGIAVLASVALIAAGKLPRRLMATESDLDRVHHGNLVEPSDRRWIYLRIPKDTENDAAVSWVRAALFSPTGVVWVKFDCLGRAEALEEARDRLEGCIWVAAGEEEPVRPPACEADADACLTR